MNLFARIKEFIFGKPLPTHRAPQEKLSNVQGLAIFSSDALSSTAYATEEILWVLILAGTGALLWSIPITFTIVGLILLVTLSYRQTIHAYPQGGGAYTVAKDNFGETLATIAGGSLLLDYILTVVVSVAAGVAAITSAIPPLLPWRVFISVAVILFVAWGNLRGVRESGKLFALPTYLFIFSLFALIAWGFLRIFLGGGFAASDPVAKVAEETALPITLFLILRAFSSGCAALTGIEATSNGVQAFQAPQAKNAANTMAAMSVILAAIFIGLSFLASHLQIIPKSEETVLSQIARVIFGGSNIPYFMVQSATALILLLAANTSFADLPRVAALLAQDRYFPKQFRHVGSRLVYANGILALAVASILLIVLLDANTHSIIPLYAIGVFIGFTLSQLGMVRHWRKQTQSLGNYARMFLNGLGGTATLVVLAVTLFSKFGHGGWISVLILALIMLCMRLVKHHYDTVARQLSLSNPWPKIPAQKTVIILVGGLHLGTIKAIKFAKTLKASHLRAVHIADDLSVAEELKEKWEENVPDVPLDIIESPYRDVIGPAIEYIENQERRHAKDVVVVVMPVFIPKKLWHHFLHNHTAWMLHLALENREDVEIVEVPYRLKK